MKVSITYWFIARSCFTAKYGIHRGTSLSNHVEYLYIRLQSLCTFAFIELMLLCMLCTARASVQLLTSSSRASSFHWSGLLPIFELVLLIGSLEPNGNSIVFLHFPLVAPPAIPTVLAPSSFIQTKNLKIKQQTYRVQFLSIVLRAINTYPLKVASSL